LPQGKSKEGSRIKSKKRLQQGEERVNKEGYGEEILLMCSTTGETIVYYSNKRGGLRVGARIERDYLKRQSTIWRGTWQREPNQQTKLFGGKRDIHLPCNTERVMSKSR